uniref:Uncharacterized protein n=1 Tax=Anguilla anguilla TaxID=7936 RepID=A0A0E9RUR0_ANGAN
MHTHAHTHTHTQDRDELYKQRLLDIWHKVALTLPGESLHFSMEKTHRFITQ